MKLNVEHVSFPLRSEFAISRGSKISAETVRVTLENAGARGRGECVPYARYNETVESVIAEIEAIRTDIESRINLQDLQSAMPAGAARCAVDCALWDLEAKSTGTPVWQLAGLPEPRAIETAETVAMAEPSQMAKAATEIAGRIIKLKIGSENDLDRLRAVHQACPEARLILDANEGMSAQTLQALAREAADLGAVLIEQPLPASNDTALQTLAAPVAICADESAHTSSDIEHLVKLYDAVNVKLDKAGGLTEALSMVRAAKMSGMGVMIGCMVASSISMAPGVLLGQLADVVDLDGPLWLAEDVAHGLVYERGSIAPPQRELWG